MLDALSFTAALIVLVTVCARGADHPSKPSERGLLPLLRLHIEKLSLLSVGLAAGATMLGVITHKPIGPLTTMLLVGIAAWMLTHPKGWWRYVSSLADDCMTSRTDP